MIELFRSFENDEIICWSVKNRVSNEETTLKFEKIFNWDHNNNARQILFSKMQRKERTWWSQSIVESIRKESPRLYIKWEHSDIFKSKLYLWFNDNINSIHLCLVSIFNKGNKYERSCLTRNSFQPGYKKNEPVIKNSNPILFFWKTELKHFSSLKWNTVNDGHDNAE